MLHKFAYIKERPMLMAQLRKENGRARYMSFLIDSGSDYTVISYSMALSIDIDYGFLELPEIDLEVANSESVKAKKVNLVITIREREIEIPVLIANKVIQNLLGRKGMFDYFDITFQESKKQVIFKEI